jgi:hypothetical protein
VCTRFDIYVLIDKDLIQWVFIQCLVDYDYPFDIFKLFLFRSLVYSGVVIDWFYCIMLECLLLQRVC